MANPHVDPDLCIGCGLCADLCPEVFVMNDDGLAEAIEEETDNPCAQEAANSCPTDAITL